MAERTAYGDESYHAIFLQWEVVDAEYRRGMALTWTGDPNAGIDRIVSAIKDSAPARCAGCFADKGELHALGCDNEECAECKMQLIGCGHLELHKLGGAR